MLQCNQNINKGPWWKKGMAHGMCPPTTCSGVWLMRYHLGNVRHTEVAGGAHRRRPQCWNREVPPVRFAQGKGSQGTTSPAEETPQCPRALHPHSQRHQPAILPRAASNPQAGLFGKSGPVQIDTFFSLSVRTC